jgi:hypothetical protein
MERQTSNLDLRSYYNAWEDAIQLSYSLTGPEKVSISLYSIDGVLFRQWNNIYSLQGHNQVKLSLATSVGGDLTSGIYLVRLSGRSVQESRKIVIMR